MAYELLKVASDIGTVNQPIRYLSMSITLGLQGRRGEVADEGFLVAGNRDIDN